jgi:hypothetical protein
MKKQNIIVLGIFMIIASYIFLLFVNEERATILTTEDGLIENLSAVFWFLGAIILFYVYFRSKSERRPYFLKAKRNIFYLLLGIFFVVCCGEEISWGQRIFKIETPEILKNDNAQGEINIHNLWVFQGYDKNENSKTGIEAWYTSSRIFTMIWIFYCLLIPIINRYSVKTRNLLRKLSFPVIPLWIGVLFLANHIISKIYASLYHFKLASYDLPTVEIKETNFAILFFLGALSFYYLHRLSYINTERDYAENVKFPGIRFSIMSLLHNGKMVA